MSDPRDLAVKALRALLAVVQASGHWRRNQEAVEAAEAALAAVDAAPTATTEDSSAVQDKPVACAAPPPLPLPRPLNEWDEEHGAVLWWYFPVDEPPYAGHPNCDDWPGYHTHWTPIVVPPEPALDLASGGGPAA